MTCSVWYGKDGVQTDSPTGYSKEYATGNLAAAEGTNTRYLLSDKEKIKMDVILVSWSAGHSCHTNGTRDRSARPTASLQEE